MPTRRGFLVGAAAAGLSAELSWADAGGPRYLAAAKLGDGSFRLFGLDGGGTPLFSLPLPGRGHAAAAHPTRPEAVAFARRPGTFAQILDCARRSIIAELSAPDERHFYGHGAFSQDGTRLFTTENAYELGEGRIGVWDATDGYRRIGEFHSGGIGPHDLARLPGTDIFVVANGGIDTHPDTGRTKLNIPTMRPNLSYVTAEGALVDQAELPGEMHKSSIRHLAVCPDGRVTFACQWQGDMASVPPLQGLHRQGSEPVLLELAEAHHLEGYAGSIAVSGNGARVSVTYPRANRFGVWNDLDGRPGALFDMEDACGVAPCQEGFLITAGTGRIALNAGLGITETASLDLAWDNHLVAI